MSWNGLLLVGNATLFWALSLSVPPYSYWPKEVRQRVRSTYTYFTAGIGVTAVAAYVAARTQSVMRFMVARPVLVCYVSTCKSRTLCDGDLAWSYLIL